MRALGKCCGNNGFHIKTFRLEKTTLRVRVHAQTVGLNAETQKGLALNRGRFVFLDIPFYRTSAISAIMREVARSQCRFLKRKSA